MRGGAAHGRGAESNGAESREQRVTGRRAEESGTICAGLVWRESGCVWEREDIKLAERSEPERALYCVLCELEHKNTVLPIREYGE